MGISIKELRYRTDLSQSKFAKQFGIPLSTLRKWEQGEATPASYFVNLLAMQLPADFDQLQAIECKDGQTYYYDPLAKTIRDKMGNCIRIHEDLEGVKKENLPLYVQDLFESFYEIQNKFDSDCRYDKQEDFIWS